MNGISVIWELSILVCLCFVTLRGQLITNYEDFKHGNRSCDETATCETLISLPSRLNEIHWHACNCDRFCAVYSDCCVTSPWYSTMCHFQRKVPFTCVRVERDDIYMMTRCPPKWENEATRELCENGGTKIAPVPVTSKATGVTYRNVHCALCHEDVVNSKLVTWNLRLGCSVDLLPISTLNANETLDFDQVPFDNTSIFNFDNISSNWNSRALHWSVSLNDRTECKGHHVIPESFRYLVRRCNRRRGLVDDCPGNWKLLGIRKKCEEYTYLVYGRNGRPYRNPHCAICNGDRRYGCSKEKGRNTIYLIGGDGAGPDLFFEPTTFNILLEFHYPYGAEAMIQGSKKEEISENNQTFSTEPRRYSGEITAFGLGASNVFLGLHLIAFMIIEDLRNLNGKNLASLCSALLLGNMSFLFSGRMEIGTTSCKALAILTYFGYLASFFWMLTIAYDIWRMLNLTLVAYRINSGSQMKKFVWYSIWSWVVPASTSCITIILDSDQVIENETLFRPLFGVRLCWFSNKTSLLIFFAAPLAVIMIFILIFFSLSSFIVFSSAWKRPRSNSRAHIKREFVIFARLTVVSGLTWTIGLFAGYFDIDALRYAFIVLNTFQGVFIFIAFTCNDKVIRGFKKIIGYRKEVGPNCQEQPVEVQDASKELRRSTQDNRF